MEKIMNKKTTTIKKLYYIDPLAAAYMAREFGVAYITKDGYSAKSDGIDMYIASDKGYTFEPCVLADIDIEHHDIWWQDKAADYESDFYIHPDSYPIFEPIVGDMVTNVGRAGWFVDIIRGEQLVTITSTHTIDEMVTMKDEAKIIQRNNKPFFMPEVE